MSKARRINLPYQKKLYRAYDRKFNCTMFRLSKYMWIDMSSLSTPSPVLNFVTIHSFFVPLPRRRGAPRGRGTKCSVHVFVCVCVCMCVCMYVTTVLCENWTEWTQIWCTNCVVCRDPIALGSPCSDTNCGSGKRNFRGGHENSPKFSFEVNY